MFVIVVLCWIVTFGIATIAAPLTFMGLHGSAGAPQQAAVAAIGVVSVVIPYVFTRALHAIYVLETDRQKRRDARYRLAADEQEKRDTKRVFDGEHKACPECAEMVKKRALKCRYCAHEFPRAA